MLVLTNCRYVLMKAMRNYSLLIFLLNMAHDKEDHEQRRNNMNHRLWKFKKVLYLSASPHCQHIQLLRCVRSWDIYFHLR